MGFFQLVLCYFCTDTGSWDGGFIVSGLGAPPAHLLGAEFLSFPLLFYFFNKVKM
jgi:hypothetical protein